MEQNEFYIEQQENVKSLLGGIFSTVALFLPLYGVTFTVVFSTTYDGVVIASENFNIKALAWFLFYSVTSGSGQTKWVTTVSAIPLAVLFLSLAGAILILDGWLQDDYKEGSHRSKIGGAVVIASATLAVVMMLHSVNAMASLFNVMFFNTQIINVRYYPFGIAVLLLGGLFGLLS